MWVLMRKIRWITKTDEFLIYEQLKLCFKRKKQNDSIIHRNCTVSQMKYKVVTLLERWPYRKKVNAPDKLKRGEVNQIHCLLP